MSDQGSAEQGSANEADFRDLAALAAACGLGGASVGETCGPSLIASMSRLSSVYAATKFGALLLAPELQANCLRIETLAHLAIASGQGAEDPSDAFVAEAFAFLGSGYCGRMEDPAEDVFVGTVRSPCGNFRVLEGIWEGNAFHLQRFLEAMERMPSSSGYDDLRSSAEALLRLSDLACERAGLSRHQTGGRLPVSTLVADVLRRLPDLSACLRFSPADLSSAGIDGRHLEPFCFPAAGQSRLLGQFLGNTLLERRPLLRDGPGFAFVLPTAASAAIRCLIVERLSAAGMRVALARGLANAYASHISETPFLGGRVGAPVVFPPGPALVANVVLEVDAGRFLHTVFFADGLKDFEETGLGGTNPDCAGIGNAIDAAARLAFEAASGQAGYVGGLSLAVGCGIGRGASLALSGPPGAGWQVETMSAYDFHTLSWLEGFSPLKLWRTLELQERSEELGLSVRNMNGLVNLIGWAKSLDGDIVPHGRLPEDAISDGRQFLMMIDQGSQLEIRHEVGVSNDPRVATYPGRGMLRIRKAAASSFEDDKAAPLYATDGPDDGSVPKSAYLAPKRTWWAELEVRQGTPGALAYERWRCVAMWLSRAAPLLDSWPGLPDGSVVWQAVFQAALEPGPRDNPHLTMTRGQARETLQVEVDRANSSVVTRASAAWEDAIFHPENIAEGALMEAFVSGVAELAGEIPESQSVTTLLASLVPDVHVRHGHAFLASGYRERLGEGLLGHVVRIAEEDGAMTKLGFGWQARERVEGSRIAGRDNCLSFLGRLVSEAEDGLCAHVRKFDRRPLLEFLLHNMEEAAFDRDRWKRTAAAVLALHPDREATLATMAEHEFRLNAVFQASRILVEIAICESPLGTGRGPGEMDLSLLIAKARQIYEIGGWSDAIRWGVMEPSLRITPLGDVHANLGFVDEFLTPHARVTSERRFGKAAEDYGESFVALEPAAVTDTLDPDFSDAWTEEFGATFDETRLFLDVVEHLGSTGGGLLTELTEDAIATVTLEGRSMSRRAAANLIRSLTLASRPRWRETPPGFADRDRQPWRYRRRLSLLRRPLLRPDPNSDNLITAPGMLRECLSYMLGNFLRGDFPDEQLKPGMIAWKARAAGARGAAFGEEVAQAFRDRGWKAETELKLTKLLRRGFERDFGDVDVLAWEPAGGRLFVVECKDVQFRKTFGEIAEQLADFRGCLRPNGKPDYLLRHLERVELIRRHSREAAAYVGASGTLSIESHLLFRNPVPMEFALSGMREKVTVTNFADMPAIL